MTDGHDSTDSTGSSAERFGLDRRNYLAATGGAVASMLGQTAGSDVVRAAPGDGGRPGEDAVLVGVDPEVPDIAATVAGYAPPGAEVVHRNDALSYVAVAFPEAAAEGRERFLESVAERPNVRYAEENAVVEAAFAPDDPEYGNQYVPETVGADEAWDATLGDSEVTVAVVDTGVQYSHADLSANFRSDPGTDFVDDDSDPAPDVPSDEWHGTHIAGVLSAATDNGTGVAGMSEATLIAARVLDESGRGYLSDVVDGIQWAADQGADVINLSFYAGYSETMETAVQHAHDQGAFLVASAGNNSTDVGDYYPASFPECVAVAGLNQDGSLYSESNYGEEVELCAPAESVLSTTTGARGDYEAWSGTSVAASVVSGTAALALSRWDLSNRSLREHLKRTAADVGLPSAEQGEGRVDAGNAIAAEPRHVVDDFEDGDLGEYSFDRGESGASVVTSPTFSGSRALQLQGENTELISRSGLGRYPSAGDTFRYRVRGTGGVAATNLTYGVQNHSNRYFVRVDFTDDRFVLYRYENDSSTQIGSKAFPSIAEDTWYEVEVDWGTDGSHVLSLYDDTGTRLARISAQDATWSAGGVGYDAYLSSNGGTFYVDGVTMEYASKGATVDDFEDGDLAEYSFDRGESGASVTSGQGTAGSNALEITGTNTELISTSGLGAYPEAGDTFRYRVRGTNGADITNLTYGVQDHSNRYFIRVDLVDDRFVLYRYENDSSTQIGSKAFPSLTEDTWYEVEVDWGTNGSHVVTLYDETGNRVAQISAQDATWTSGGVGYDAYLSDDGGTFYYDELTLDEGSVGTFVDDFEDGDLAEYTFDRGSSGASVVSSPTYAGTQSLEITGTDTELISTSGLGAYPSAGDTVRFHLRATDGATLANVTYGVQDHQNRYFVQLHVDSDDLELLRLEGDSAHVIETTTSGFSFSQDTWYEVEVDWRADGTHVVTVYDETGGRVAGVSGQDATWTTGGIGYDAYLSGGGTVNFDATQVEFDAATSVVDDFEDRDLAEYTFDRGEPGASVVTEPSFSGSYALQLQGENTELISTGGLDAYPEPGDTIRTRFRGADGAPQTNFTYGVQDHQNRYFVGIEWDQSDFGLYRYESDTSNVLDTTDVTLSHDTWYELEVDWGRDGSHVATLYDETGSQVAQVSDSDSTWTGGGVGYDAYLADTGTVHYDATVVESGATTVESFEDGDLAEYTFDRGSSGASVVSSPTYSGSNALELSADDTELISTSGLGAYPSAGDTVTVRVRAESGGDLTNFTWGVQDHQNRYFVQLHVDTDELELLRLEGDTAHVIDTTTSGFTFSQDTWYEVEVDWGADGSQTVTVYDEAGSEVAQVSGMDATWSSGGIGFDAYLSDDGGSVYFDDVTVE